MNCADQVRLWIQRRTLAGMQCQAVAEDMGISAKVLARRLKAEGTSWRELKREEQIRRLGVILSRPGKVDIRSAALECGFFYSESFLEFFKQVRGQTFTAWRMDRQGGIF